MRRVKYGKMDKLIYKMPLIRQIHELHLLVDEIKRENLAQQKVIKNLKQENARLYHLVHRLEQENDENKKDCSRQKITNETFHKQFAAFEKRSGELSNTDQILKTKIGRLEKEALTQKDLDRIKKQMRYDFFRGLAPERYKEALCEFYYEFRHKRLNLDHPKTFNEKIQWIKLFDSTSLKTRLADKVAVREWVKEKIGERYLIPCLGVWNSFDEIDIQTLPDQFVLKANHGSGWNIVVTDKKSFQEADARKKFYEWLGTNFAWNGLELHYKNIPPKIYAEKYIGDIQGELCDYRFLCFHDHIRYIWADIQRGETRVRKIFDSEWQEQDFRVDYPRNNVPFQKPATFEKMKEVVETLCRGFLFVRVDMYDVNEKIYFGEMTFTSKSGLHQFYPQKYDAVLGEMLTLPIDSNT